MRLASALCVVLAVVVLVPPSLAAQSRLHPRWEVPGFDFRKDGAWRVRARQVSELRHQLLAQGRISALNAPRLLGGPAPSAAVTGTMLVPTLLFSYQGVDSAQFMRDTAQYSSVLFGAAPPGGNPYTLRTYYEQLSDGDFSMLGRVIGWVRLDSAEVTYTGPPPCAGNPFGTSNCNGLFGYSGGQTGLNPTARMQNGFRQALTRVDAAINFAQFDNNGPDLVPNSGDDDGYVDMIMFAHATKDGACGGGANNHIWSHRFVLANNTQTNFQDFITNDARFGGGSIRISDYFATTALGGATSCDTTQIMPIGTAAHEFGHALGLPDLYDTDQITEGIGQWGLMSSGNFTTPRSPSRMEAWSLNEMGWVTLASLSTSGTYRFGAAPVSDTAFYVNVQGTNTRNEYFLLENRQAVQADTAMVRIHCQVSGNPPGCGGGMLIWHIDGQQVATHGFGQDNSLNTGSIHGVALMQADGINHLRNTSPPFNRGDAGDPYPGTANNTVFSLNTNPAARKNLDDSFVGFAIDSIRQVVLGGEMAFRLRFGGLTVVRASDSNAVIQVDGGNFNVFTNLFEDGSTHTISVADTQLSGSNRTRWRFVSWSDAGLRTHDVTGTFAGATYTATLDRDFRLNVTVGTGGTVSSNPSVNIADTLLAEGTAIQLTATPDGGFQFNGWTGDTTTTSATVTLPMGKPYAVTATFASALAISSLAARPNGVMGASYRDTLRATGGTGTFSWSVTGGALPQGVTLLPATGILTGFPEETGNFSFQATVVSGAQSQNQTFTFSVAAPTVATASVVTQVLGLGNPLTLDEVRYLDFLGNTNGSFDVGDFLAWVKATGAPLSAELMTKIAAGQGGRP